MHNPRPADPDVVQLTVSSPTDQTSFSLLLQQKDKEARVEQVKPKVASSDEKNSDAISLAHHQKHEKVAHYGQQRFLHDLRSSKCKKQVYLLLVWNSSMVG